MTRDPTNPFAPQEHNVPEFAGNATTKAEWPKTLIERALKAWYNVPLIDGPSRDKERMHAALDASGLREAVEALEKISAHVPLEQAYDDVLGQRIGIARATLDRIKGAPND